MQMLSTESINRGDPEAFAQLFAENRPKLLALAHRLTSSAADAEDVVQDAFVSSWKSRAQFAGDAKPSTWLYRVTFNAALMKLRTKRRKGADSLDALPSAVVDQRMERARQPAPRADDAVDGGDARAAIESAMHKLAPLDRDIVRLRFWHDLSTDEVAAQLGLSTAATKTRLHRARARLRDTLHASDFAFA